MLAAAEAFAGRGFDGANLVDIAAAAGVTTGAVYSHFRGKPELLADVVTSTLETIDPLRRAAPPSGRTPCTTGCRGCWRRPRPSCAR